MAKKTLLRLPFESEYRIIGIVCTENDYRFCWLLNQMLAFDFKRVCDFTSHSNVDFSVFHFDGPESMQCSFYLVNNRSADGQVLFAAPAGIDYLMLIKADEYRFNYQELLTSLRSIRQLLAAYRIDDHLGKNRDGFLYDFEMFVFQEIESVKKESGMWKYG
jgi:hypothetical protein